MHLSVTLDLPPLPILDPVARRRIIAYELRAAKEDVLAGLVEHARRLAPVATGTLRDAIVIEEQVAPGDVYTIGTVTTNDTAGYAAAVEYGSKPHWAPIAPLKVWAALILGDEQAAYAVRGAIARRGTRAQPFFAPAADAARERAPAVFHAAMARMAQQLQGG